jgi:glucosyl-dolichyl phosphate glucuronosyltransferase
MQLIEMTNNDKKLTVAICTYNRADMALARIQELRAQRVPSELLRFIVIDNSDDLYHTNLLAKYLDKSDNLKFVHIDPPSLSRARNEALRLCETRYLAFIDDDAIPCEGWVRSILDVFEANSPAVVGGPISLKWPAQGPPEWLPPDEMGYLGQLDLGGTERWLCDSEFVFGGNMAFDMLALRKIGGFSPALGRTGAHPLLSMEEIAVQKELRNSGFRVRYSPDARVFHLVHEERLSRNWFRARAAWQMVSEAIALENPMPATAHCAKLMDLGEQQGVASLLAAFFKADNAVQFSRQLSFLTSLIALLLQAKEYDDKEIEQYFTHVDAGGDEIERLRERCINLERQKDDLIEQCKEAYNLYNLAAENRYQLLNSASWRITAPLRIVGTQVRRAIVWFGDAFSFL